MKGKKTKRKPNKPQDQVEFKVGDLVGAKLKGYPLWPGLVERVDVISNRRKYTVRFFHSNDTSHSLLEIKHFKDFTATERRCPRRGFKEALALCQEQADIEERESLQRCLDGNVDNRNGDVKEDAQEEADDEDKMLVVVEDQSKPQSKANVELKPKNKKKQVKQAKKKEEKPVKGESSKADETKAEGKNESAVGDCDNKISNIEQIAVSSVQLTQAPSPQNSADTNCNEAETGEKLLIEIDKKQSDESQTSPPDPAPAATITDSVRNDDNNETLVEEPSSSPTIDESGDVIQNSKSPKSEGENVMVTSTSVTIAKLKEKVARKLKEKEARKSQLKEIKLTQKVCKKLILYSKKLDHFSRLTSRLSRDAKISIEEWDSGFKKFSRVMENLEKLFCKCSGKLSNASDSRKCHQTLVEIVANLKTTRKNKSPTDFVPKVKACLKMIEGKGAVNKFIHDEGPKNAMTERKENDSE